MITCRASTCDSPVEIVRVRWPCLAHSPKGLQLFASFAMLMNFPRFNKMKGMGQIVTWSVRDETLHTHIDDPFVPHLHRRKQIYLD